jgi:hypothetical protein
MSNVRGHEKSALGPQPPAGQEAGEAPHASAQSAAQIEETQGYGRLSTQIPSVPFNGEAASFPGWTLQMRSALEYLGLWEAVSKPPAGALATRSVIEDEEDEVQDVAEDDAASAISSGARPTPPAT